MILSVLNNETAIEININIMRAFITVRQYLISANGTIKEIEELKQRMKALEQAAKILLPLSMTLVKTRVANLMISIWLFRNWPINRSKPPLTVSR